MSNSPIAVKWLHSPSGRSKRTDTVAQGCYVLEHDATGRFYMGESSHVSQEVDRQLALLAVSKHPCKLLNGLYERDNVIRVYEYPCAAKRARKKLLQEQLDNQVFDYLCLNPGAAR
mgnify:CR=1 FL=1